MTSGHYPDEPHLRSEIALLSPASPKPLHFPTPTNIPVLDNMMDVGFNQTELHMADPAMHNTELRPGAWQDPNAPKDESVGQAAGGEAVAPQAAPHVADSQAGAHQASASDTLPNMSSSQNAGPRGVSDASVAQPTASFVVPNPSATESASHRADFPAHPSEASHAQPSATPLNGEVDVQALLNTLQSNSAHANSAHAGDSLHVATASSPSQPRAPGLDSSPVSAAGLGAPPSGLPPRPPPQEQPLINANYTHSQHIRDYHPHAANPAYQNTTGRSSHAANSADPSSQTFVPPVHVSTEPAAPGTESSFSNPAPMNAQEQQQAALGAAVNRTQGSTPLESRREYKIAAGLNLSEDDTPWTADTQRKYDKFIEDERKYVSEGRWEQFPHGSRLFVGNLSSERVTKRDIFHAFHRYGDLAQISIKQAYGFVQFLRPQDCAAALSREEGRQIRGKKIHLEVSKPQRNRNPQDSRAPLSPVNTRRRSRSPDYNRGGNDRYAPSRASYGGGRDDRDGRGGRDRERDGYRPYRSPSPPPRGDRYRDDRYRDRSPPYTRGGRYSRNHSPTDSDDGLPLPKRAPQNVPDVQIISNENLNRDFINWIEKAFQGRGLTVDVLYLSPRLDFDAVVRRQLVEGVLAVCRLSRANQDTGLINLRLFDRTGAGANNIKFDDYDNQDLQICVELVSRKKQSMWGHQPPQQPPQQHYGYGQAPSAAYGMPPAPPPGYPPGYLPPPTLPPTGGLPPGAPVPPNLQQLITSLDPKGLQNLLAAMQPAGASQAYAPQHSFAPHQQAAITALQHNPNALAGYLQQQQSQQSTPAQPSQPTSPPNSGAQVNMQEILARLGTYK